VDLYVKLLLEAEELDVEGSLYGSIVVEQGGEE
jgi:hypothetical protein